MRDKRTPKDVCGEASDRSFVLHLESVFNPGAGGTLGISWWGCAAGSLEPLTFTKASSAEFCYPILE